MAIAPRRERRAFNGPLSGLTNALSGLFDNIGNNNQSSTPTPAATTTAAPNAMTAQQNAFNAFYETPFYQVPLERGLEGVNAYYAGRGLLQSGAAQKAISDYAAGSAAQGFRDYTGMLQNQQGIGANATNAYVGATNAYGANIAGLNANTANALSKANMNYANNSTNAYNNYVNSLNGLYSGMANAQGQYATSVGNINSNAAIANANNTNAMIGGIGNAAAGVAGYYAYQPYATGGTSTQTPSGSVNYPYSMNA